MPKAPNVPELGPNRRARIAAAAPLLALAAVLANGCANPGPPQPPSLKLPALATDFVAKRIGDEVMLSWTTPAKTTDGLELGGFLTARISRQICQNASSGTPNLARSSPGSPPPPAPLACPPAQQVQQQQVHPGPSSAVDALPRDLTTGLPVLLAYQVELVGPTRRSAGPSPPVYAAGGPAPAPVSQLQAKASPGGAVLEWQPDPAKDNVELDRTSDSPPSPRKTPGDPLQLNSSEPARIHLRAGQNAQAALSDPETSPASEPGGTIDRTAHPGQSYRYSAFRVRQLTLAGHPLEVRSKPSPLVSVVMKDVFPPRPPAALESVANLAGGAGPGRTGPPTAGPPTAGPSIDLSWEPNPEPDLAGYNVYRRTVASPDSPRQRLTPVPVSIPAFHDSQVGPGHVYAYAVTAVDKAGNESAPSAEVQEKLGRP